MWGLTKIDSTFPWLAKVEKPEVACPRHFLEIIQFHKFCFQSCFPRLYKAAMNPTHNTLQPILPMFTLKTNYLCPFHWDLTPSNSIQIKETSWIHSSLFWQCMYSHRLWGKELNPNPVNLQKQEPTFVENFQFPLTNLALMVCTLLTTFVLS